MLPSESSLAPTCFTELKGLMNLHTSFNEPIMGICDTQLHAKRIVKQLAD